MKSNTTLKTIGNILSDANSVLIMTHLHPDGDAIGSSTALCMALRKLGINAWVLLEEPAPAYLSFLRVDCCTTDKDLIANPDVSICVDCSGYNRIPKVADMYDAGSKRLCIDHHINPEGFGESYYIDEDSAATTLLIYKLLKEMGVEIDKDIAESLYTGLSTDTGNLQYSNTSADVLRIGAELMELGIDHQKLMRELYQNKDPKAQAIEALAMSHMEFVAEGKAAVTYVTKQMLAECGAEDEHTKDIVNLLRDIKGVEVAAFVNDRAEGVKISMRSKGDADVNVIASKYDGGGHAKAAGCTIHGTVAEAIDIIKQELVEYFEAGDK